MVITKPFLQKKKMIGKEFGYLSQDFEPLREAFRDTFTKTPLSIFGVIFAFVPGFIISFLFFVIRTVIILLA